MPLLILSDVLLELLEAGLLQVRLLEAERSSRFGSDGMRTSW